MKHIQGRKRINKEEIIAGPTNVICFKKKAIYKINYESV